MSNNKKTTQIILQIHKGAIRLAETGKFSKDMALQTSIKMMKGAIEEVLGPDKTGTPDPLAQREH